MNEATTTGDTSRADTRRLDVQAGRLSGVFGVNRSGTTWLGALLNAHARIAYRFEPFHRLGRQSALGGVRERIECGEFDDNGLPQLYRLLVRANPLTEKPPFFDKEQLPQFGRTWLWRVARVMPPVRPIFARRFSPGDGRPVVFKEVGCVRLMAGLLHNTSVPIVYLLRNPFATIASQARGQRHGKMSSGRFSIIPDLVNRYYPEFAPRFDRPVDQIDPFECNALLWRHDTDKAIEAIRQSGRGLIMTHEQLCDNPLRQLGRICTEFKLEIDAQMRRLVEYLEQLDDMAAQPSKPVDVRDGYFTVFRNPRSQKDKWKSSLSPQLIETIGRIVIPSQAFHTCAEAGGWANN